MNSAVWALIGVIVGTLGTGFINWLLQTRTSQALYLLEVQNKKIDLKNIPQIEEQINNKNHLIRSYSE